MSGDSCKISQREKIKNAAMKVFSQKGFHSSSVQEIADEAGVNKSLFFYYFQNKENLFYLIFKENMQDFLSKLQLIAEQKVSPIEKLKAVIDFEANFYIHIMEKGILSWGIKAMDECFDILKDLKDDVMLMISLVSGVIKEGVEAGVFRSIDPDLTARLILSSHQMLIRDKILYNTEISKEKFAEFLNTLFTEGLLL